MNTVTNKKLTRQCFADTLGPAYATVSKTRRAQQPQQTGSDAMAIDDGSDANDKTNESVMPPSDTTGVFYLMCKLPV